MENISVSIQRTHTVRYLMPFADSELVSIFMVMQKIAKCSDKFLDVALVADSTMQDLNSTYANSVGPTNVLSFPTPESKDFLGWLAIAPEVCAREAFLYNQDIEQYIIRLCAHGYAHLLGYDHGADMDAYSAMLEQAALHTVGIK